VTSDLVPDLSLSDDFSDGVNFAGKAAAQGFRAA
jgi:hypothetical protein